MKGKIHRKLVNEGGRMVEKRIVAICDADLLGKVFEEGERVLDLQKYRSFYEGEMVTEKGVAELLEGAMSYNLVGKKSIAAAGKVIRIDPKSVMKIGGIPHLQVYFV